jgi:Pyridoxamine 5'-phosphate oxidase
MLTVHDRALLDRPLHGLLTVPPAAGRLPAPRPVWFELTDDGQLQLFSATDALKVRRFQAAPRASLVAVRPTGELEGWLSIEADVTLHSDGGADLAARLAERYWDMTQPEHREAVEAWAVEDLVRIVLHPRRVTRGPS